MRKISDEEERLRGKARRSILGVINEAG